MATMTRANMIAFALQRLGVLAQGQSPSAADADVVGKVLDSVHGQLRKRGLAPFATSSIPDWAWVPFAKTVEEEAGPLFGIPRPGFRRAGESELAEQVQAKVHRRPVEVDYY